jgi:hypothetical protein
MRHDPGQRREDHRQHEITVSRRHGTSACPGHNRESWTTPLALRSRSQSTQFPLHVTPSSNLAATVYPVLVRDVPGGGAP